MSNVTNGLHLSRRTVAKGLAGAAAVLAAPAILRHTIRSANAAAKPGTIRMLAGPTVALQDWAMFEKETGLKMEFTPFHVDDVGALYNEILVNEAGERYDIISALAGVQRRLIQQGQIAALDTSKLKNYGGISETVRRNSALYSGDNKDWGVPIYMNADSFGYFPTKLNQPRPPAPLTWDLLLNSKETLGQSSLDGDNLALMMGGMYLKSRGMANIKDPANMTPAECKLATDWLIERKRAGQFRSFWKTYDEQVANFVNGEVLVQRCWEPAVREVRRKGLDVEYATCSDFHVNWMHAMFMPVQAASRSNVDEIYRAMDWFIGGSYAANLLIVRGYTGSRIDLGIQYAKDSAWDADKMSELNTSMMKVQHKLSNPNYWITGVPDELEVHESEMARFKNA